VYLSHVVPTLPEAQRRVLLGAAFEALRGGYALVTRIGSVARREVTNLLDQLVRPESERTAEAQAYIKALPRKSQKALEKLWGGKSRSTLPPMLGGAAAAPSVPRLPSVPVEQWLADIERAMRRAGLLACDDLGAAAQVHVRAGHAKGDLAQTNVQKLDQSTDGAVSVAAMVDDLDLVGEHILALDRGPQVADLIAFYLSEPYHLLRSAIGDAVTI
jgi:hypothetical protein